MSTLKEILKNLNINNDNELKKYISDNYNNQSSLPLKIMKHSDMRCDNENRIYDEEVEYKNTIFDLDQLVIVNSKKISFTNCIFTGQLKIGNRENKLTNIYMDYVSVKESVIFYGSNERYSIDIYQLSSPEVKFINNIINDLRISHSNICSLIIMQNEVDNASIYLNTIKYFKYYKNDIEKIHFPRGQLDISTQNIYGKDSVIEIEKNKHPYLEFFSNIDYESIGDREELNIENETYNFLLSRSDYHISKSEQSRLKYLEGLSSLNSNPNRIIYQAFGGLIIPYRILILIIFTIIFFALIYWVGSFNFNAENLKESGSTIVRVLHFKEALYFSGISFTTIGYGDMSPVGIARYVAISEGIIGIVLSSSLVVSLTKRYIG